MDASLVPDQRGANILLAGEALVDVDKTGVGSRAARKITQRLEDTLQAESVIPKRRQQAGRILGELGWTLTDLDSLIEIPAGTFLYGDPPKTSQIPYRYWIGKYPVTNLQFGRFIEAEGYHDQVFWSEAGWAWKNKEERDQPRYWSNKEWNNPTFPVVGVSWYEAEAYCSWLNTQDLPVTIPGDYCMRLPTEQEWEQAGRGMDGREYPWGKDFHEGFANTWESQLGSTTAVNTYPQGVSPDGVWDLSGNVWEWTASWLDKEMKYRVVRGGSWDGNHRSARCACRAGPLPSFFGINIGFRVVLSLARPGS
jgi:formylglycine-generating enzyme required for sulfatase activity